jgi:NADH-quinone oxidoreductase subunit F
MQIEKKTNFKSFEKAIEKSPEEIIQIVEKSNLKGRGGAAFSTGMKWKFTRNEKNPKKYLICNFDEGEPGTIKDKFIADNNPAIIIEGIAIASYAIEAKEAYIYLRGEYVYLKPILENEIKKAKNQLDKINLKIDVFLGAGAYICGDETSIMNSIENIRPEPRSKPPFPAKSGLYKCPTCINNVETLANVPLIIEGNWKEKRLFSISGDVQNPGVFEEDEKILAKDLFQKAKPKNELLALFFGCSGGCVRYSDDLVLDSKTLDSMGAMLGSATIIAVDKTRSIIDICINIAHFFVHESCGKCTPCREGNIRILEILEKIKEKKAKKEDFETLEQIAHLAKDTSFCGLGQTCATHILCALKHFEKEVRN